MKAIKEEKKVVGVQMTKHLADVLDKYCDENLIKKGALMTKLLKDYLINQKVLKTA